MPAIPRDPSLDSTLALLSEGYTFASRRYERYNTDIFETRLMLSKAIFVRGEQAARMFYIPDRFTRKRAVPPSTLMLLQDKGSAQLLEGVAHRHRKHMFMSLMTPENIERLVNAMIAHWRRRAGTWASADSVVLHSEVEAILAHAVCEWAGIPAAAADPDRRARELAAMIDGAGAIGPRNWRGLWLRSQTERWARGIIDGVRVGRLQPSEGRALHTIAWHRDLAGELLDTKTAAVELTNILRPTVAVAWYITFAAHALYQHPASRERLQSGHGEYLEWFVQEVRRFYPLFIAIGGIARDQFEWRGRDFAKGTWVLLDVYGTNHDPRTWRDPDVFDPERFRQWDQSAFNFIPQGGGNPDTGHRCPGEWIAIELTKAASRLLARDMRYDVPQQDLTIDLSRLPAIPESRFVMRSVRLI